MRLVDVDDLKVDMIIEQRDFMSCGVHLDCASVRGVTLSQILTAPKIETKQIKYFDEDEKVWKTGSVIVE